MRAQEVITSLTLANLGNDQIEIPIQADLRLAHVMHCAAIPWTRLAVVLDTLWLRAILYG